jgi:hypothetical protein
LTQVSLQIRVTVHGTRLMMVQGTVLQIVTGTFSTTHSFT